MFACPAGSRTANGSSTLRNCSCDSGHYLSLASDPEWEQNQQRGSVFIDVSNVSVNNQGGTCTMDCIDVKCRPCGLGRYSVAGATVCTSCPLLSTTLSTTSAFLTECVCNANYYLLGSECEPCPGDMISRAGSDEIGNCSLVCLNHSSARPDSILFSSCQCHPAWTGANGAECSECAAGTYKDVNGSSPCHPCPNGTYSHKRSASCTACQTDSFSPQASGQLEQCVCNAGFTGADGGNCSAVPPGTFKAAPGSAAPTNCGAGRFSNASGMSFCYSCPLFSNSSAGSATKTDCVCTAGYTGLHGGPCHACSAGQYKAAAGSAPCTFCVPDSYQNSLAATTCNACPAYTTSPGGQPSVDNCTCRAGFTGADGGPCETCAAGTFKNQSGSERCQECDADTYNPDRGARSARQCVQCPFMSISAPKSASKAACLCAPGFTGALDCHACLPGTYKDVNGTSACTMCPRGKYGVAFAANASSACVLCAAGSYSDVMGLALRNTSSACTLCPSGTYSPTLGAVSLQDCQPCAAGTFRETHGANASRLCVLCEAGSYAPDQASSSCTECAAGKFSDDMGATSASACLDCPAGTYSPHPGASAAGCFVCPAGTYSSELGQAVVTTCKECPANQYGPAGSAACLNCPMNSESPRASVAVANCTCLDGFSQNEVGGICFDSASCPLGTVCVHLCARGYHRGLAIAYTWRALVCMYLYYRRLYVCMYIMAYRVYACTPAHILRMHIHKSLHIVPQERAWQRYEKITIHENMTTSIHSATTLCHRV